MTTPLRGQGRLSEFFQPERQANGLDSYNHAKAALSTSGRS